MNIDPACEFDNRPFETLEGQLLVEQIEEYLEHTTNNTTRWRTIGRNILLGLASCSFVYLSSAYLPPRSDKNDCV